MLSNRWWRAIGIATPVLTAGLLLLNFPFGASENLFQTGITPALILGIANIVVAIAIYKNRI